ncbi:unnamed protein product [Clavelina lepadiformis]|uniref:small monomeric GTPase n=1 Tax=Clavelina lepadiformis TaxID=159417 RepID=A0ABP0FX50_CLALP
MNSNVRQRTILPKSNAIRRTQSSGTGGLLPRSVRVVVLGVAGVGKTAMAVRFVTKRFIGDYDPTLETIYRHTTEVDNQVVNFEIMDTAGQEENSLMLEDKCKWGESFIFVYDVTDKYSFDELSRLKFIASYTHSKMRVNFTPCWILVGNKADLAERERMVTPEEGMALARDLGCHLFREISVKESTEESKCVFEDLWREFSKKSPRSPSSSQRKKFSYRIQDKIPVLESNSCTCTSEAHRKCGSSLILNGSLVSNVRNTLRRQTSVPIMQLGSSRKARDFVYSDANNNDERFNYSRDIDRIPEDSDEDDSSDTNSKPNVFNSPRARRNALTDTSSLGLPALSHRPNKALRKSISVDNVFIPLDLTPCSSSGMNTPLTSSSASSSNTSLNAISPCPHSAGNFKPKRNEIWRGRIRSDGHSLPNHSPVPDSDEDMVSLYHDHCRRNRSRGLHSSRCNQSFSNSYPHMNYPQTRPEVEGF